MRPLLPIAALTLLLLLAYAALLAVLPAPAQRRYPSLGEENRAHVQNYAAQPASHPVVIVGSSLSKLLPEARWGACVTNLALSGASSLTGLAVIDEFDTVPAQVFVETNVLEKPVDASLLAEARSPLLRLAMLRVDQQPLNLLISMAYSRHWDAAADRARRLAQPRDDAAYRIGRQGMEDYYRQAEDVAVLQQRLDELATHVQALQRKGADIRFFEMPIDADLRDSPRARQRRAAVAARFGGRYPILDLSAQQADWQTADGIHLVYADVDALAAALGRQFPCQGTPANPAGSPPG